MLELTFNPYKALERGLERWLSACLASMSTCVEFDLRNLYEKLDVVACACFPVLGRQRQVDLKGSLSNQPILSGETQASEMVSQKNKPKE